MKYNLFSHITFSKKNKFPKLENAVKEEIQSLKDIIAYNDENALDHFKQTKIYQQTKQEKEMKINIYEGILKTIEKINKKKDRITLDEYNQLGTFGKNQFGLTNDEEKVFKTFYPSLKPKML